MSNFDRINPAQQVHGQEEIDAAIEVLNNGHWAEGEKSKEFRKALKEYLGVRHVILTNSGSSANLAALMSLTTEYVPIERRIYSGDEVITTALCFPTTVSPIVHAGAVPVFVDVEPGMWNIDPNQVEDMITHKTKAIMVAHNLGNPFDLESIMRICEDYGITLIEDNADALGSTWNGSKTGSFGHVATSSFYPAHHISTGEGGAVYTNNAQILRGMRSMVNWGRDCWCEPGHDDTCNKRYDQQFGDLPHGYDHKNVYTNMGFNLKMTDIQAAIGVEQLKRVEEFTAARQMHHRVLWEHFSKWVHWFELPVSYQYAKASWFGYVVKLKPEAPFTRDEMVKCLDEKGIRSRAFFAGNITKQPAFHGGKVEHKKHPVLAVSDDMMNNSFWIGVHPGLKPSELQYMIDTITQFLEQY